MDVPVKAGAVREVGIDGGEESTREDGGNVGTDEVVGEGDEEEFVDVDGEGGEGKAFGEGGYCSDEERGRRDGEGVVHGWGWGRGYRSISDMNWWRSRKRRRVESVDWTLLCRKISVTRCVKKMGPDQGSSAKIKGPALARVAPELSDRNCVTEL